ncbi:MAG: transglutaminase-like domain-containing protein [Synergistaceae bacterium]|nr:transglutaminase-like domain-containing protein [Synergistaceae bacterium]
MKAKIRTAFVLLVIIAGVFWGHVREAAGFAIPVPSAPGTDAKNNSKSVIDYSNAKDGYVMVKFAQKTSKAIRAIVKGPSGDPYTYVVSPGNFEVFPFSKGNGEYTIGVYEQTTGTKYATANTATVRVRLTSEFAPFLTPNQYVNYNKDNLTVKKAAEIVMGSSGLIGMISAIYNFIINHISYDEVLARNVQSGYLPNVDAILRSGKGICFDYSVVMAAMLRSLGIPCSLEVGYSGRSYHAWISTFSKETGTVNNVIRFDGKSWTLMDPTFASSGKQSPEIMKFIGDGSNYKTKFRY